LGYFDASLAPALRVKSGDMIRAEAVTHHAGDAPELLMDEGITAIFEGIPEKDRNPGVHIMTGPIFIEDAKAGDVLEVRYLQMIPRLKFGSNWPPTGAISTRSSARPSASRSTSSTATASRLVRYSPMT